MATLTKVDTGFINDLRINKSKLNTETVIRKDAHNDSNNKNGHKMIESIGTDPNFKREIVWFPNVTLYIVLHIAALYGVYLGCTVAMGKSVLFAMLMALTDGQGVTFGAHRLYAHKTFKATFPLRIFAVFFFTCTGQNTMFTWVRDHRLHHKYTDTDADPHNSKRGFFFSHMGWLMSKKHPLVMEKGKTIDMSDLLADPVVMFQKKHFVKVFLLTAIMHIAIPMYFWNESLKVAVFFCYVDVIVHMLHVTWTVNSIAHLFGPKPYDKSIRSSEAVIVSLLTNGEGWHNYHHSFPRDYRASEYISFLNVTAIFIDLCAFLGLASDLRTAPQGSIKHKAIKHGDNSHYLYRNMVFNPEKLKHLTQEFDLPPSDGINEY